MVAPTTSTLTGVGANPATSHFKVIDYSGHLALAYMGMRSAAHFADHWIQTDCQAMHKGLRKGDKVLLKKRPHDLEPDVVTLKSSWIGRLACGRHVSSYVATQAVVTMVLFAIAHGGQHWWGLAWGLTLSAVTHYWADRRSPLQKLAEKVGKGEFYKRGEYTGSGAYALDQSWHHAWETIAAVLIALN